MESADFTDHYQKRANKMATAPGYTWENLDFYPSVGWFESPWPARREIVVGYFPKVAHHSKRLTAYGTGTTSLPTVEEAQTRKHGQGRSAARSSYPAFS
jgi:hypothetical protein